MKQSCKACNTSFKVTDDDLKFYDKISPVFNGKKYDIPAPTHCPECRQQRRLALCNEFNLYPVNCNLCNEPTVTEHPSHNNNTIYCRECWNSDKWDQTDYGRDVDFSRPFFDQILELRQEMPLQALMREGTNVNSEYIHYAGFAKNCYLIMHADYCEDCYYGYGFKKNISCVDGLYNLHSELCYDCIDVHKCYGLKGSQDCMSCHSSAFLRDCIGCKNCFLCVGLREKEYCFENQQLSKEEYEKKMADIDFGSYEQYQRYKAKRKDLEKDHPFKEFHGHNLENCSGDYLINCKDTHDSFNCEDIETGKFCYQVITGAKDVYDIYQYGLNLQQSYECSVAGNNCYHILFTHNAHINSSDLTYCWFVFSSKNCFGCVSMHHKEYCILNKQYTKEEYEELVPQIIEHMKSTGEWGEFFSLQHATFGYNKTSAQMYYPLTKEQALAKGIRWDDVEDPMPDVEKIIPADQLPDNIDDIPDDILNWAIECEITKKPFKITSQELKFYRSQRLPIPRRNWQQRHFDRYHQRNPREFWERNCAKCNKAIRTTYSPERPEIVYCEECYLAQVY